MKLDKIRLIEVLNESARSLTQFYDKEHPYSEYMPVVLTFIRTAHAYEKDIDRFFPLIDASQREEIRRVRKGYEGGIGKIKKDVARVVLEIIDLLSRTFDVLIENLGDANMKSIYKDICWDALKDDVKRWEQLEGLY